MPKGKESITTQEYKRPQQVQEQQEREEGRPIGRTGLETLKLPKDMQISLLIPFFKKGARDECDNYRPIAITDFIYKLFSYVIYHRLLPQLEPFLSDEQRGFRPNREMPFSPLYASQRNAYTRVKRSMLPFSILNKPMTLSHRKPCKPSCVNTTELMRVSYTLSHSYIQIPKAKCSSTAHHRPVSPSTSASKKGAFYHLSSSRPSSTSSCAKA